MKYEYIAAIASAGLLVVIIVLFGFFRRLVLIHTSKQQRHVCTNTKEEAYTSVQLE